MKFTLVYILLIALFSFGVAKRIELLQIDPRQAVSTNFIPVYSSVEDFAESLADKSPQDANVILFDPVERMEKEPEELRSLEPEIEDSSSSGRTFKHFLLLKSLMRPDTSSGFNGGYGSGYGGGGSGLLFPIVINTPFNFTNVNNNTVTNTPAAADAGGAAANAADPNVRINLVGIPQAQQSWPVPMQMPTEVYHQRQASNPVPTYGYTMAMLNTPGGTGFVPVSIPQYLDNFNNINNREKDQRKVQRWTQGHNRTPQNPFAAFANSFRGIQFL